MSIPYDLFIGSFLSKITEFEFVAIPTEDSEKIVDGYLKRAVNAFRKNCQYDLTSAANDETREFDVDAPEEDIGEIVDIVSEGMVVQWLKPYVYRQELLENALNTRDFTTYSPAELLKQVRSAYTGVQKDYTQMIREYSYNHGDLTDLHL